MTQPQGREVPGWLRDLPPLTDEELDNFDRRAAEKEHAMEQLSYELMLRPAVSRVRQVGQ